MTTPPETSDSPASRFGFLPWLLLILAVGAGMYFLGRRSHGTASGTNPPVPSKPIAAANAPAPGTPAGGTGRHFAPRDTFYLLQYVSAKTSTGVIGFEPGQEVHLVEVRPPTQTLVVGDDQAQVEVGPDKLTNDLDIAAMVRQKDESNQAKIAAYVQSEQKAYENSKREAAIKTEKALDKIDQKNEQAAQQQAAAVAANNAKNGNNPPGSNSPVGSGDTKLDEPPVEVGGTSGNGGYGYSGSSYYGSPYSYFSGASTGTTATGTSTGTRGTTSVGGGRGAGGGRR